MNTLQLHLAAQMSLDLGPADCRECAKLQEPFISKKISLNNPLKTARTSIPSEKITARRKFVKPSNKFWSSGVAPRRGFEKVRSPCGRSQITRLKRSLARPGRAGLIRRWRLRGPWTEEHRFSGRPWVSRLQDDWDEQGGSDTQIDEGEIPRKNGTKKSRQKETLLPALA